MYYVSITKYSVATYEASTILLFPLLFLRCWWIHDTFSDAIERLFIQHFMRPEDLEIISSLKFRTNEEGSNYIERATDQGVDEIIGRYKKLRSKALNGDFGKTPQYWFIYTSMINPMQMVHIAIKTNDLSLKITCWNDLLPLCFATNRVHYARYGTSYIQQLKIMNASHPGALEEFENISSVRRNNTGIGQAIDLAGEQIYIKSAKTAGKCYHLPKKL